MADGYAAEFHLTFPTEQIRRDFEIAFEAFVKDFQKQQTIYYGLRNQIERAGGGEGPSRGAEQGGAQARRVLGHADPAQQVESASPGNQRIGQGGLGLISIKTEGGGTFYLNFF